MELSHAQRSRHDFLSSLFALSSSHNHHFLVAVKSKKGKNYVNNNRGVFLQAPKKKGGPQMEACFFGAGCTRPGCIYRHDRAALASNPQTEEPCMAYLAGYCAFNARSCRKRHPPPAEAERLIQKYSQIRCRYGSQCQTEGCLYRHEALTEPVTLSWAVQTAGPSDPPPPLAVPGTSWRPTPPSAPPQPPMARPMPPSVPPQPPAMRPQPPNTRQQPMPPSVPPRPPTMRPMPPSMPPQPPVVAMQPPTSGEFNVNAKEFVPGSGFR